MDERDQTLEGTLVAPAPFEQQRGDFRRVFRSPAILCSYLDESEMTSDLPEAGILIFRRWEGLRTDGVAHRGSTEVGDPVGANEGTPTRGQDETRDCFNANDYSPRQCPRGERGACGHEHVLAAIDHVGDRRRAVQVGAHLVSPEQRAVA